MSVITRGRGDILQKTPHPQARLPMHPKMGSRSPLLMAMDSTIIVNKSSTR